MPGKTERREKKPAPNGATVGYEAELWRVAGALRLPAEAPVQAGGSMDAAEHKHAVLGLIFLERTSDAAADGQIACGGTFHNDRFPDLEAGFILAIRRSTSRAGAASGCATTSARSTACRP